MPKKVDYRNSKARLYINQRGKCYYCGESVCFEKGSVDHIHPQCRGGKHQIENLAYVCRPCNATKGSADIEAFRIRLKIKKSPINGLLNSVQIMELASKGCVIPLPDHTFWFETEEVDKNAMV